MAFDIDVVDDLCDDFGNCFSNIFGNDLLYQFWQYFGNMLSDNSV